MARFGSFELDSVRRRLSRAGEEVHLTPKAFGLLTLLVEAAPRVVPKSELFDGLWPNGGAVSDAALSGLVKELRRALAGCESRQCFIRTVHRVGYAFDAPVVASDKLPGTGGRWLAAKERTLPLAEGVNLVGRDSLSDVPLDHATVSRRHARIVVGPAGALLEDLGSKNGTSVDGKGLSGPATLRDGSRIGFGQVFVTYREAGAGMPTVTQVSRASAAAPES